MGSSGSLGDLDLGLECDDTGIEISLGSVSGAEMDRDGFIGNTERQPFTHDFIDNVFA